MRLALAAGLTLIALLTACSSDGGPVVRDRPEDMSVSPRSMEAYDPAVRDLDKDDQ